MNKTLKKVLIATTATLGAAFTVLSVMANKKRPSSVYDDEPSQKNPLEGKKVIFVFDENDKENADGEKGHLEAVGNASPKKGLYVNYIKRVLDMVLSFGGLVVLSPVYLGIVLAIKADDPGPVFFTQKRVGRNKEYFKLHKFRSMKMCTPHDVPTHMLENPEQYITRVGKLLRKLSLDELPQIWDIFIGNMSVIGPRPALWNQEILISERDRYGANDIKPGLTGWAQINGRDEIEVPLKAKLDGEYVQKQSLLFDIKCFFGTILKVFKAEGVVEGGTGEMQKQLTENDNENPLVSVITPAYNSEKYIEDTVNSVRNQSYSNWEMLIVDDCSKDNTYELALSFSEKDNRIKVLRNEKNSGAAAARNLALKYAKGKYIAFLDSDDLWAEEKLTKQVSFMENEKCILSYTNYQAFNSSSGEKGRVFKSPKVMTYKKIFRNTGIGCLTVMVNREMSGEFYMPLLKHTEDNCTWQEILKPGYKAYLLPEVLSYYRVGTESLTNNKTGSAKSQWYYYRGFNKFSVPKSAFLFAFYVVNAVKKHFL